MHQLATCNVCRAAEHCSGHAMHRMLSMQLNRQRLATAALVLAATQVKTCLLYSCK